MIDHVYGGEYLTVTSNKGAMPYINMSSNQPMVGALSFDYNSQSMKAYDGNTWLTVGGGVANIHLTPNAQSILKWAEKKMNEEQEYEHLASTNPTIKSLVDEMNKYKNQIEMVKILMKEEVKL
jgi:hypothetical protein